MFQKPLPCMCFECEKDFEDGNAFHHLCSKCYRKEKHHCDVRGCSNPKVRYTDRRAVWLYYVRHNPNCKKHYVNCGLCYECRTFFDVKTSIVPKQLKYKVCEGCYLASIKKEGGCIHCGNDNVNNQCVPDSIRRICCYHCYLQYCC